MKKKIKISKVIIFVILLLLAIAFIYPVAVIIINSFKGQFYITDSPFKLPVIHPSDGEVKTFAGLENYSRGIIKTQFFKVLLTSTFITVISVLVIVIFTSMTAWFITRVKSKVTSALYYILIFSMIVPFQMVMFPMSKISNMLSLDNPVGIIVIYLGFGAGLSVFIFTGFVKSIPVEIEEAAIIDGCNPLQLYFKVVFPILKPTLITVAILNAMWIWNDYLLPMLLLGTDYPTIPVAVQGVLTGSYGFNDMGALMAMMVISIAPVIVFYLFCQKYIIKGITNGAVKG